MDEDCCLCANRVYMYVIRVTASLCVCDETRCWYVCEEECWGGVSVRQSRIGGRLKVRVLCFVDGERAGISGEGHDVCVRARYCYVGDM